MSFDVRITLPCSRCRCEKPILDFRRRPDRPETGLRFGRWSHCRLCESIERKTPIGRANGNRRSNEFRKRLKKNDINELRRRERNSNLKRVYGIDEADYQRLLVECNGLCAICKQPPIKGKGKKLHVDHDHETGEIRGLLCALCNTSLGGFNDDPQLLRDAALYIESFKGVYTS